MCGHAQGGGGLILNGASFFEPVCQMKSSIFVYRCIIVTKRF